jgi:hypothetical protein
LAHLLIDQPGAVHYGVSTDLLGFLLARIDGTTLGAVLRQRVLESGETGPALNHRTGGRGLCGLLLFVSIAVARRPVA